LYNFAATQLKAASNGTFSHNFCFILKTYDLLQSLFKCGSRVAHNPLTKQWCKALGQARCEDFTVGGQKL